MESILTMFSRWADDKIQHVWQPSATTAMLLLKYRACVLASLQKQQVWFKIENDCQ